MKLETQAIPMEQLYELLCVQMESGGRARLPVTGSSMLPMLRQGTDAVFLKAATGNEKKGDIILYRRSGGQFVLHRVIAEEEDDYICSGDNQAMRERVEASRVLAVVDGFERGGKRYALTHLGYRCYRALCVGTFFMRPGYIALRRRFGRLRRRLKGK